MSDKLKIAICGTRGIPACYGGFETFAEELSTRLVQRDNSVRVYGRKHLIDYKDKFYKGVEIKLLPAPKHKYLETIIHSFLSLVDLVRNPVDVILVCNGANSPLLFLFKLFSKTPVVINVDGIERKRAKWNRFGKLWYLLGEYCSVKFANSFISDAEVIREYYQDKYGESSIVIPYGCKEISKNVLNDKLSSLELNSNDPLFKDLNIEPGKYILFVSRLEPENNAHIAIKAYKELIKSNKELSKYKLLIVGDAPYSKEYISDLKKHESPNIIFSGAIYGEGYKLLQSFARIYIQATEVGGTHPALVEAMGFANCVLFNSTPENIEVLSGTGIAYSFNDISDLKDKINNIIENDSEILKYRKLSYLRAQEQYSWKKVTNDYEQYLRLVSTKKSKNKTTEIKDNKKIAQQ